MANVSVHDIYVHDTGGEGFYFGWTGMPPSNLFPGLQIYNCRLLRIGNEALQIQDLGDGSHVHHNVFVSGGLHWLDNGLGRYQDNTTQILTRARQGRDRPTTCSSTARALAQLVLRARARRRRHAGRLSRQLLRRHALASASGSAARLRGRLDGDKFQNNALRGLVGLRADRARSGRGRDRLQAVDSAFVGALALTNNRWEGTRALAPGIAGGAGAKGAITATGNVNGAVPELAFRDAGWPLTAGHSPHGVGAEGHCRRRRAGGHVPRR